ncbi:MAG: 16S rRNA (guanine(527)-N(7))-methyltransferase RsmG [Candidatus Poribacteria bacterium]|nr:16S rRNA (guanine(527)-N(7))-methyltransferase RsmG [Candidatus Poribacteria bacterium]
MAQDTHVLKETFKRHGFPLTMYQAAQFDRYRAELLRWNEHINLTAITDEDEIIHKHFLDSLSVLEHITPKKGDTVIDIGTGAGFPGIVLKIYVPDIRLTLVEASKKKASFLKFLIPQLNLDQELVYRYFDKGASSWSNQKVNVEVLTERAEVCAKDPDRVGAYDWVFTRYVATIRDSAVYCLPLLKPTGKWVTYKFGREIIDTEIDDSAAYLSALGGSIETVFTNPKFNRSYVVVHRVNT